MPQREQLAFVSAGMMKPKKVDNGLAREHRYLNYGLLGLATIASKAGCNCKLFHGLFDSPVEVADRIASQTFTDANLLVLLSIPSSFAIEWAKQFVHAIKTTSPNVKIIVGGRWVVGNDPTWLTERLPGVDEVIGGTCEHSILDTINKAMGRQAPPATGSLVNLNGSRVTFPRLDYSLLENPGDFHPSIEVSRGCGMGCSFCVEKSAKLSPLRDPSDIVAQYQDVVKQTGRAVVNPYFECSFFRPTTAWQSKFKKELDRKEVSFEWRTESRVDAFSIENLDGLRETGLKVIDLGLESASPLQLKRMQKTTKPDVYLKRASNLIHRLSELGIWTKVNVLLYLGETHETLKETVDWIYDHRKLIKGVSVNPLVLYRGLDDNSILKQIPSSAERKRLAIELEAKGYAFPSLSDDFDSNQAMLLSTQLSSQLMDARDYFDLKTFSYLRPGFEWNDFVSICQKVPSEKLPFAWPPADQENTANALREAKSIRP